MSGPASSSALGEVDVRPLSPRDAEAVHALRLEALAAHPEAFLAHPDEEREGGPERWRGRLEDPLVEAGERRMVGAFDGPLLVGMMGLMREQRVKRRHRADVVAVYLRPSHRGRGIAGRMLDALLTHARSLTGLTTVAISTAAGNDAALDLYRSRGFRAWGVEPDFLRVDGRPVDEVQMILTWDAPGSEASRTSVDAAPGEVPGDPSRRG